MFDFVYLFDIKNITCISHEQPKIVCD